MKNQKRTVCCLTAILISLVLSVNGQDKASAKNFVSPAESKSKFVEKTGEPNPEERLIRLIYAKLTVYNTVGKYFEAKRNTKAVNHDSALKFELENFHTGRIEEIQNALDSNLTTLPTGEIIRLNRRQTSLNNEEYQVQYDAEWVNGQYASIYDRGWTIGDIFQLELLKYHDVGKYTSYEVTVSFEGKKRAYRALCLFHNSYGTSESPKPEIWDAVVGMGGTITKVFDEQLLPFGLQRNSGSGANNLMPKHQTNAGAANDNTSINCPTGFADINQCCLNTELAATWKVKACGAWRNDINKFLGLEGNSFVQFYQSDNRDHLSGVHHGRARFYNRAGFRYLKTRDRIAV